MFFRCIFDIIPGRRRQQRGANGLVEKTQYQTSNKLASDSTPTEVRLLPCRELKKLTRPRGRHDWDDAAFARLSPSFLRRDIHAHPLGKRNPVISRTAPQIYTPHRGYDRRRDSTRCLNHLSRRARVSIKEQFPRSFFQVLFFQGDEEQHYEKRSFNHFLRNSLTIRDGKFLHSELFNALQKTSILLNVYELQFFVHHSLFLLFFSNGKIYLYSYIG